MINITYKLDNGTYTYLKVTGHAQFEDVGKDLICASVSSIFYGLMNALDEIKDGVTIHDNEDQGIEIIIDTDNEKVQNYIELVLTQLKTIEFSYKEFIRIKERK